MLTQVVYSPYAALWKTPVEKAVENVEKYSFSTAILRFSHLTAVWITLHIRMHKEFFVSGISSYVTGQRKDFPVENVAKC
jgi:hypothetical protein